MAITFSCQSTGDSLEAEAVEAAFSPEDHQTGLPTSDKLHVGSIKTIIGHIGGQLALLSCWKRLENGILPPNMLLDQPNHSIERLYRNLCGSTRARPWPHLLTSQPRRASVKSFCFGGTNADAILGSYKPKKPESVEHKAAISSPFTFSANTEPVLEATSEYLALATSPVVQDLSFSWNSRRMTFPTKAAFAAQSIEDLRSKKALAAVKENAKAQIGLFIWYLPTGSCHNQGVWIARPFV